MPRTLAALFTAMACALALPACGAIPERPDLIGASEVAGELQARLGYPLEVTPPPVSATGLPQLAATVSGGNGSESVTAFVFYDPAAVELPLGRGFREDDIRRVARNNVLVLYRRHAGAEDRSKAVADALAAGRGG